MTAADAMPQALAIEIAAETGLTVGTVKHRKSKLRSAGGDADKAEGEQSSYYRRRYAEEPGFAQKRKAQVSGRYEAWRANAQRKQRPRRERVETLKVSKHPSLAVVATRYMIAGVDDLERLAMLCAADMMKPIGLKSLRQYRSHFLRWGPKWLDRFKEQDKARALASPERVRRSSRQWRECTDPVGSLLGAARNRAARAGLPFDLTRDHLDELCRPMTCSLTGLPLEWRCGEWSRNPWKVSLDQIDPGAGYIVGNVRVVAWAVNQFLREWTVEALLPLVSEALENRRMGKVPSMDAEAGSRLMDTVAFGPSLSLASHLLHQRKNHRSKRSGKQEWTLDRDWIEEEFARGTCAVTGLSLRWSDVSFDPLKPSIDRIDCDAGYTPENSRLTCMFFNLARGEYLDDQFWMIAERLVERHAWAEA